jgi:putative ubiquitin-RnfH superfamily antitoxin RatB of RatAB toxin-antitoxin module
MNPVRVTVAWISPTEQDVVSIELPARATVALAIAASKFASSYKFSLDTVRVGINGHLARLDSDVADGDRVEIYRPLIVDPKDARRARSSAIQKKGRPVEKN